ncbi:MAG TPA: hypothetical protein VFP27_02220 [Mycobacterium sp.]|nr:hypothetical protein [Mycobacterium sp.]
MAVGAEVDLGDRLEYIERADGSTQLTTVLPGVIFGPGAHRRQLRLAPNTVPDA